MSLGNVHLTPQLVRAVREAADVVAIANEHTRLRRAGRRYQGLCPLHKEKTPSFSVDPDQGLFYCFGCGRGGDAIKLHMLTTGDDFPAAIETLALRHGIPLPTRQERRPGGGRERDVSGALQAAAEFFTGELRRSSFARGYLERRRVSKEMIERFGLGYAPDDWHALEKSLQARVPLADLEAAGLLGRSSSRNDLYDRFRNRLMFPIHSPTGKLVGFGGRTLGDDSAKYVNTSETEQFHKGSLLYGLHLAKRALRDGGRAVLVEGYFDVIACVASGLEGTVAGMGTALTPEQARLLSRFTDEVVVGYDGDSAGENAYRRALPLLLAEGMTVRRARFGEGEDPDSLRVAQGEEAVLAAVEASEDAILLEMDRLAPRESASDPRAAATAAAALRELLGAIPDPVVRHGYLQRAAERLRVPEKLFLSQMERRPASPQPAAPAREERGAGPGEAPGIARSMEEQVLELLLKGDPGVPPPETLPPPEVFFDPECRNIYQVFCTLYGGRGGAPPPDGRAVLAELGADAASIDRMAQILVEAPVGSKGLDLSALLAELTHRRDERRLRELASEIGEAQRTGGDEALLLRLYEEKRRLSLNLHGRRRPGAGRSAG